MALIPVFYTASTKDVAEKSHEQGILKYPGICWIQDIETVVYVSSDNELHYAKGNEQIDKVIGAVSGHLPTLNDDGSLVDSGKSPDDFDEAGAAASALADAKSYINKKISELINGAPETADTLKELNDLVSQNKDVITSLDTLLSKKADITAIPTTLPNPNALTFSGLVEGNYDGSEAVNIEVPQDMWIHVTIDSSGYISERDTTFEEINNYYTSHPSNNIFMSCLINNIECIGTLESASPGNSYTFGVMPRPSAGATVYRITKKNITIDKNDYIDMDDVILSIPSVSVSGGITFERAVCELLTKADIGYVIYPGSYGGGNYYLVIKTGFDRGYGGCLVYDRYGTFKSYSYTTKNGTEWTITPTSSPNIISITTKNGKYYSSHNFNEIKEINPENMLVCYNNAYGRLVSMDDNEAIFKILKSTVVPFDVYIRINSDDSIEVKLGIPYADLNKSDDNTYALNLLETFMYDEFAIIYYDDVTQSSYLGKAYKSTNDETIFRIWLSETEIMDVTVNLSEINGDTDLSAVPVTVEKTTLGCNSFIVKVTPTYSNSGTTYNSDHSFSEIKEAYDKGLNPIVIYGDLICQMVYISMYKAEFINYSHLNNVEDSCKIVIDESGTTFQTFTLITSNEVIPDLDRVLDTMDPIYPSSYPVSAQAIGKLRDSIKESIPTKLSQLESRDYDSLENKPIVSINDLIDGDKFTYTETKPNAKGFVTRTYKFIINPDLDFNDRLFRVDVPDNVGNIMILIVTKKTDGSDYLTYYIMGAGNGEILAINTDKANKMMVVNRVFTGSRMLIEFDDTGCYKNSTSYFSVYKSDVLTKTNTVEFTPEKDYHPATKKYVDDAIAALKAELTGSTGESTETENHGKSV